MKMCSGILAPILDVLEFPNLVTYFAWYRKETRCRGSHGCVAKLGIGIELDYCSEYECWCSMDWPILPEKDLDGRTEYECCCIMN